MGTKEKKDVLGTKGRKAMQDRWLFEARKHAEYVRIFDMYVRLGTVFSSFFAHLFILFENCVFALGYENIFYI